MWRKPSLEPRQHVQPHLNPKYKLLTWVALRAHGGFVHPDPGQERADDVLVDGDSWVPPAHAQAAVKRGP